MQVREDHPLTGCRQPRAIALLAAALAVGACSSSTRSPDGIKSDGPREGTVLVISDLRGTLKPCGCSPDLRRGGVARIREQVKLVRRGAPGAILVHAGDLLLDDEGIPEERQAQVARRTLAMAEALGHIGLDAATLGPDDVAAGMDWLEAHLGAVDVPIVVTNVTGPRWAALVRRTHMLTADGLKVGIIGLVPPGPDGVVDPVTAARGAATELRAQGADVVLVLSSLGLRQAKRLMRKEVGVDLLLAAGQGLKAVITDEVEPFEPGWLFQSFVQGGQLGRLGLIVQPGSALQHVEPGQARPDGESSFTFALTPIGWDLPRDPQVAAIMEAYDTDLRDINLAAAGTLPPLEPGQASYVGVEKCLECHEPTAEFWKNDKHPTAWATLETDGKTFDLECVSCHATGYGKPGGSILGAMGSLTSVQCESCHGPGSTHSEEGDPALIRREVPARYCTKCHNRKHSTGFHYERYRARIVVPGHGK